MFPYKFPIAIVTSMALLQPPIVIAQDIAEVNNIARNISVKITGHNNGSGFILDREEDVYYVVTNKHVVPINTDYQVQTYDGTKHQVTNRQEIPNLDLAIIQFASTNEYEVAELGDSEELVERQFISVAGFPGEQTDIDIIDGQIRSIRQDVVANPASKQGYALIYTNQTLPGSSGGAVLDEDGRVIAINGEGETDIKTGRDISRGIPVNLFLAAEEELLATGSSSTTIDSSATYQLAHDTSSADRHSDWVYSVAIENTRVVSASKDGTIKVWNLVTGEIEQTLSNLSAAYSVAVSNNLIVAGSGDRKIRIWNLATGELEQTLSGHSDYVTSVAIVEDKIISGSRDNTIKIWDLATGELEQTLSGHSDAVYSIAVANNKIISGSRDNTIKIWDLATGELEQTLSGHSDYVTSVAVTNDKIISGSNDNTIKIWDFTTGELEQTLSDHTDRVTSVAVAGNEIVSGSWDKTIKVWNLTSGKVKQTLTNHSKLINSVAIGNNMIVSGSWDNTIKVWQLQ